MTAIVHFSTPCASYPLTHLLRLAADKPRFYFESTQSPRCIAAIGIAARLQAQGSARFTNLQAQACALFAQIHPTPHTPKAPPPLLIGGGAFFDHAPDSQAWASFPAAVLILPRLALIHSDGAAWLSVNLPVENSETAAATLRRAQSLAEATLKQLQTLRPDAPTPFEPDYLPGNKTHWEHTIQKALACIHSGALRKVVLACQQTLLTTHPAEPVSLLTTLAATCPRCFRFLFEFHPGTAFAGATPERLVAVQQHTFRTAAVAGSIGRSEITAQDEALGQQLLASAKDQHEHALVVQYMRAHLQAIAASLNIAPTPQLLRLPNIQHLWTEITGTLRPGQGALDVVQALHPTPAVGGLPAQAALQFIQQHEGFERGWYAGPIGWMDAAGNGDFAVAIRSALFHPDKITFFGGAGIVAASQPEREWEETGLKMQFLLNNLQAVPA